ncbi:hypothetical protein C8R41DRAFT_871784 [Lentinula lateritia]|uniref:Uncharacterized protein n=1 Tax=Lentinula lateritia TaxID=40482 RepID=A0ABQ8UZU2_9AGAR|nr:hypothetical protein C8R41DRAFT_871784 [Lentinula lateritia]
MLYFIVVILLLLVQSLHASPINKLRARGVSHLQTFPPSIPKGSTDVVQASITNFNNPKLKGADIQLHGKKEFVCALQAHQSWLKGPSDRLCVLQTEEEKFNELEKIESVEDKTSLTTVIVHPGDRIWISAETLARADLFAIKCFSSEEGNKIRDAKWEISTEKWNIVDKMPLLEDLTHYTPPPRNYTLF